MEENLAWKKSSQEGAFADRRWEEYFHHNGSGF